MSAVARLRDGGAVLATWLSLRDPSLAELLGRAGFEVVLLDLEHGEFGPAALPDLVRATVVGGAEPVVRVRLADEIGPALDAGAAGVLVPDVRSATEAAAAVAAVRYAPEGVRGAAPMVRDAAYGATAFPSHRTARRPLVGVQVEGPAGLAALDDVLAVDGLDVVFVGTFDLAQHLGLAGDVGHPDVLAAVRDVVARADAAGVATGVWAPEIGLARTLGAAGVRLVSCSSATSLLFGAARAVVDGIR